MLANDLLVKAGIDSSVKALADINATLLMRFLEQLCDETLTGGYGFLLWSLHDLVWASTECGCKWVCLLVSVGVSECVFVCVCRCVCAYMRVCGLSRQALVQSVNLYNWVTFPDLSFSILTRCTSELAHCAFSCILTIFVNRSSSICTPLHATDIFRRH